MFVDCSNNSSELIAKMCFVVQHMRRDFLMGVRQFYIRKANWRGLHPMYRRMA
jgi:hypothetical protein